MKVFQDPTTGTYVREDGKPGYACARCGNGYATAETRNDTDAHGCEGLNRDLATFADAKATLENGYDEDTIESLFADLSTAEFVCLWGYYDDYGFGGDSEILGREISPDGSHGPWKPIHASLWAFLFEPEDPIDIDEVPALLSETDHEVQNVYQTAAFTSGANAAYENRND